MEKWQTLRSRVVFERRRMRVVEDIVRLPNGEETDYLVLRAGPGVAVLAVGDDGRVVLVRQYRHPIGESIYELPGGGIQRGERLEDAARRELREETGLEAGDLIALGSFFPSPARASTEVHVFLARRPTPVPRAPDPTEDIELHHLPSADVLAMVERNEIRDATTIFALTLADRKGLL